MKISLAPDMNAWRQQAITRIDQHFNELAARSLHHDLAQMALGESASGLLARELHRQELFALLRTAQTPAQIEDVLSSLT